MCAPVYICTYTRLNGDRTLSACKSCGGYGTGCLTFDLLDAAQGVLERVQRAGLALAPLVGRQLHLQVLQGLDQLLLSLGFGRLFATAGIA